MEQPVRHAGSLVLSIIIPVYNEAGMIEETVDKVHAVMATAKSPYELLVVDDGSSDGTADLLRQRDDIKLIVHPENRGYGASLKDGFRKAAGEHILILDADGTYPIDRIPDFLSKADSYDMIVGARDHQVEPINRRFIKSVLFLLASFLAGRRIPDLNSGMRLIRKDLALRFLHLYPSGFSLTTTITLAAITNDYSVTYLPIAYFKRVGDSSFKFKDAIMFLTLIFRIVMFFRPIRFFLPVGVVVLTGGIAFGLYQAIYLNDLAQGPLLLILGGMNICFMGLLAEIMVRTR